MNQEEMIGFWKTVVDTMMDGLIVVDSDGMIVAVNRASEEITGYTREELIGSPCTILNCDQCTIRQAEGAFMCDLFETKQIDKRRCALTRKDGTVLPVVKNAAVLSGNDGKVSGGVETITDLSGIVARDLKIARLSSMLKRKDSFHGIIGKSRPMQDVFDLIADAAQSFAPIIIYGESGTGKELVAAAIHRLGTRKHGPFVKVNCAALTESLLQSELFGHVKGAYTGADRNRKGRFELADGGNIFLDEIGDIPLSMQVKILRVLQEKEFERVGDSKPIKVDVRIISATHRDLSEMIARNEFREDLFYRLNVIPIRLPPLRERREDLPLLIEHFIEKNRFKTGKDIRGISEEAMSLLMSYSWPGNIRELLNAIEYGFVVCRQAYIDEGHLPETIRKWRSPRLVSRDNQRDRIVEVMRRAGGKKIEAARLLGISRQALWKKMVKLGIKQEFTFNGHEADL
ncbi:MAG TPA: sigma 54-interacting transcriptional regulator [Desulfomonilaceae bacterium]|nr:sigma 54-interacting transcriptional regulator [Desulfomonilaceae bacterium]